MCPGESRPNPQPSTTLQTCSSPRAERDGRERAAGSPGLALWMVQSRIAGAALTARPVLAEAWRRCCREAGLEFSITHSSPDEVIRFAAVEAIDRMMLLIDHAVADSASLTRLQPPAFVTLLVSPASMSPKVRSALGAG